MRDGGTKKQPNEDRHLVSISADYFFELYRKANETDCVCDKSKSEAKDELNQLRIEHNALQAEYKAVQRAYRGMEHDYDELKMKYAAYDGLVKVIDAEDTSKSGCHPKIKSLEPEQRFAEARKCIKGIEYIIKCHKTNFGGPSSVEVVDRIDELIRKYRNWEEGR